MSGRDDDLAEFLSRNNITSNLHGLANLEWRQDEAIASEIFNRGIELSRIILDEQYRNDNEATADFRSMRVLAIACMELLPQREAHLMDPVIRFSHSASVNQSIQAGVADLEFDHQCRGLLLKTELCQSYHSLRASMNETPPVPELVAGVFMIHAKT